MKKCSLILAALASLPWQAALAQDKEDRIDFNSPGIDHIRLPTPSYRLNPDLPFTSVRVVDNRTDTSCLGIIQVTTQHLTVLALKQGTTNAVGHFYSSAIDSQRQGGQETELNCVIQRLILSDHIFVDNNSEEEKLSSRKLDAGEKSGVMLTLEFYARLGNEFLPLLRFDTTLTGHRSITRNADTYLEDAFHASLRKINGLNWERISSSGKRRSWEEIMAFNKEKSAAAILHAPPTKGIFLTFKDFRNNTPIVREFSVEKGKKGDFLYVKNEKKEDVLLTELWGYSDGKDYFIYSANNYFKLHRTGSGFKIFGAKDLSRLRNPGMNAGLADLISPGSNYSKAQTRSKYYLIKTCLLVDMDSGELY